MKTEDLIGLIAADASAPRPRLGVRLLAGAAAGGAVSFGIVLAFYGMRPAITGAWLDWRVAVKFAAALALATTAGGVALRMSGPVPRGAGRAALAAAPVILLGACVAEIVATPADAWLAMAMGRYPLVCLVSVPLLASLPLLGAFWALREAAPNMPAGLGAAAGAMAGGLGAAIYALHCTDDSPLFLMLWYSLACLLVTAAGRAGGARFLRW